jgi:chemotaxis protein methyltransferase CheR
MQDSGLVRLSEIIYDYCGLSYADRLPNLEQKIKKRVSELGASYQEYCDFVKRSPQEWDVIVELLTVNETYFYREENQLIECCSIVLPKLKDIARNRPLRIWSAACSTGEEPFTLAMMILDSGKFLPGTVEIIATDINKRVLQKAETGLYNRGSLAFRRIPEKMLKKYFLEKDDHYQIMPNVRKMVQFKEINLLNKMQLKQIGEVDIIFCRNVLIYFDQLTNKQVIRSLHQVLSPGGYLFLGHAESISDIDIGFNKVDSDKTFYYRKETD